MRKIEKLMLSAVHNRSNFKLDNTEVEYLVGTPCDKHGKSAVYLHGNLIAYYDHQANALKVDLNTLRKWSSMTTRSRIRALGANLVSIKGTLHLDGKSIYAE